MHLVVDAVGAKHSGAAIVLLDFLKTAEADPRLSRITVFCTPQARRNFSLSWSDKLISVEMPQVDRSRLLRLVWYMRGIGHEAHNHGADVVLCMSGQGRAIPPTPHVTFVQQSLPFSREAFSRLSRRGQLTILFTRFFMRQSCQTARHVIVQTPTMGDWVSKAFGLTADKLTVIMPTSRLEVSATSNARELDKMRSVPANNRFLYVGNGVGYKMIETVIEGMSILRRTHPYAALFLTLAPNKRYAGIPGIHCLGYLPRQVLYESYMLCTALVMPSLVETVSLPMMEAMSLGKPILAADRPYAHDVCADAALFFDPLSPQDFADRALLIMRDADLRGRMVQSGLSLMQQRNQSGPYRAFVNAVVSATN